MPQGAEYGVNVCNIKRLSTGRRIISHALDAIP